MQNRRLHMFKYIPTYLILFKFFKIVSLILIYYEMYFRGINSKKTLCIIYINRSHGATERTSYFRCLPTLEIFLFWLLVPKTQPFFNTSHTRQFLTPLVYLETLLVPKFSLPSPLVLPLPIQSLNYWVTLTST